MPGSFTVSEIEKKVADLSPWFHNLSLAGVQTAPTHFLGDYPSVKWKNFESSLPSDMGGMSVLDIGCNGGFYSLEMKRRGAARVLGIDHDDRYLEQARFAAKVSGSDIEFRKMSVYELPALEEKFDLVLFMGVFYHLRHPLLALDLLRQYAAKDWLVFQSMQRGSQTRPAIDDDYPFWQSEMFDLPGYPKMHFVEKKYSQDATNWWIPNRACVEAVLRSAGFYIANRPETEVYICRCDTGAYLHPLPEYMAGPATGSA